MQTLLNILTMAGGWRPDLYLWIENPPYLALVIASMNESGPRGLPAISVAHYGELNGDAVRDPEMCFEVDFAGGVNLDPFYFRHDYVAIEEWSRFIAEGRYTCDTELHRQHRDFARLWCKNLRAQGFVEALERQRPR
jgi:hypothetical protein